MENNKIKDFSAQRNLGLTKAKNEWILFVDDDEIVSPKLRDEILAVNENSKGFYITRKNLFLGKVVGEDKLLRIARKNSGKWERMVHEVWKVNGKVGKLKGHLIHETARSLREAIAKTNFYSTLHAQQNLKDGKKSSLLKIIFFPVGKLTQNLLTQKGFVFGLMHSFHSFLAWSKLWFLENRKI